jgi:sulfate transport system permease protein
MSYVSLIVLIPMFFLVIMSTSLSWNDFMQTISDARVLAAYKISFACSLAAALINCFCGVMLAWVFVRYRFPGRRILDGLIELPFALPTAVSGIALTALYTDKGWLGSLFAPLGLKIAYTPYGIVITLIFITLPFIVRSVQPVLEQIDRSYEEAGRILGASKIKIFWRVVIPELTPALLTGFGLAFARALGEYGSVVFIAGNMPFRTEIAPLLIMSKLEQFNYGQATSVALVMLAFSFVIMFAINLVRARAARFAF